MAQITQSAHMNVRAQGQVLAMQVFVVADNDCRAPLRIHPSASLRELRDTCCEIFSFLHPSQTLDSKRLWLGVSPTHDRIQQFEQHHNVRKRARDELLYLPLVGQVGDYLVDGEVLWLLGYERRIARRPTLNMDKHMGAVCSLISDILSDVEGVPLISFLYLCACEQILRRALRSHLCRLATANTKRAARSL
jgi:hypothetical protein